MKLKSAPAVFLWMAWALGTAFAMVTPPFQVPDEFHHFYRAYQVSEGQFTATRRDGQIGGELPTSLLTLRTEVSKSDLRFHRERKQDIHQIWLMHKLRLSPQERTFLVFGDVSWHAPINYLPQAIGIAAARAIGMGPLGMMYAGRLTNLLAWSIWVFAALRMIPVMKWTLLMLAMTPMCLAQAASLSADATVNGICFFFVAVIVKSATAAGRISKTELTALMLMGAAVALAKTAYVPLLLLFLMIPASRFKSRAAYWRWFAGFLFLGAAVLGAWALCTYGAASYVAPGISPPEQARYILHHPLRVLGLETSRLLRIPLLSSVVGRFGWYDTPLWLPMTALYAIAAVVTALQSGKANVQITARQKFVLAAAACGCWLAVFTLIYLVFSAVGGSSIEAVQGRYLIPITPAVFFLLYPGPRETSRHWERFVPLFCSLFAVYALATLAWRFYV